MRRGLLKVALADDVKASSSERGERHVVGVRFPALVKQARLENFRVMCINDGSCLLNLLLEPLALRLDLRDRLARKTSRSDLDAVLRDNSRTASCPIRSRPQRRCIGYLFCFLVLLLHWERHVVHG
jgi:hypothetical protein